MDYYPDDSVDNGGNEDIFRVLSTGGYVGYNILFEIPVVGFITSIVFSFDDDYIARRNFARSRLIRKVIGFVLSGIIFVLLAMAIMMESSNSTINVAQYARFAQEFGEYSDNFKIDCANVKSSCGIRGQIINEAQMNYMAAHGYESTSDVEGLTDYKVPTGYKLELDGDNFSRDILTNILKPSYNSYSSKSNDENDPIVAYVINDGKTTYGNASYDNNQDGSAGREFYGDANGKEYHLVTSNGNIFTLPGFPVEQPDGTIEYHIDTQSRHYYVVPGSSNKSVGSTNVNGDKIDCNGPINATDLKTIVGMEDKTENEVHTFLTGEPNTNKIGK